MSNGSTSLAHLTPQNGARLANLDPSAGYVTIINTKAVASERAEALLDLLIRATDETMRYMPGFVSGNFHIDLAGRQVVNQAPWQSYEAITAAGTDPKVKARICESARITDGFMPILYDLPHSVAASAS